MSEIPKNICQRRGEYLWEDKKIFVSELGWWANSRIRKGASPTPCWLQTISEIFRKTKFFIIIFCITRSYAALRAADLDWIIGPGYSSGGYILGENHEKPEASPPDSRLSNSRSSGEDGEPPSPSDEGDGPRRSPSPNRRAPAPPRRPHQDVPSRRTVEPVSRKKSH